MGRRGRPPVPTELKIIRGNPGKRRINRNEPTPRPGSVSPPEYLTDPMALAIWHELAPELANTGRLAVEDRRLLATACRLQASGEMLLTRHEQSDGPPKAPLWGAIKCLDKAGAIFGRFGIGPSDRTRITVHAPAAAKSKWAGIL